MNRILIALLLCVSLSVASSALANPERWRAAGWMTDFTKTAVAFSEIISGGPPRDGIPSIDDPQFKPAGEITDLGPREPVIRLEVGGEVRGYPLQVLTWHEIVNDTIGGIPIAVTYCPLCNSAVVFDRRLGDGTAPEFGVSGLLRNSDLVMYDRETQSWWQQFTGDAIVGSRTGEQLKMIPSRVEGFAHLVEEHPDAMILVPNEPTMRPYGRNPYVGYDSREMPYPLYTGGLPAELPAMMRVVVVKTDEGIVAVTLAHLRQEKQISIADINLTWRPGVNSALADAAIAESADVGAVDVVSADNGESLVHDITFAFVVHAFHPDATIHTDKGPVKLTTR
jgi:hypothetical protein